MNRWLKRTACLAVAAAGIALLSTNVQSDIVNSKHDLADTNQSVYIGGEDQTCRPCHTPHESDLTVSSAPLWNHTVTAQSFTRNAAAIDLTDSESLLCLSCHDGQTAIDSYGGAPGAVVGSLSAAANVGTDLSGDHPIGVVYPGAGGATVDYKDGSVWSGSGTPKLENANKVGCTSCHDPHLTTNGAFLRMSNASSALCTACHTK